MMNMREYWDNEYAVAEDFDAVVEKEWEVFEMEDEELVAWANAHNVDLTATVVIDGIEFSVLEVWGWDFQ